MWRLNPQYVSLPLPSTPAWAVSPDGLLRCRGWLQIPRTQIPPLSHIAWRFSDEPPSTSQPTSPAVVEPRASAMMEARAPLYVLEQYIDPVNESVEIPTASIFFTLWKVEMRKHSFQFSLGCLFFLKEKIWCQVAVNEATRDKDFNRLPLVVERKKLKHQSITIFLRASIYSLRVLWTC